jgi:hypothetical protein
MCISSAGSFITEGEFYDDEEGGDSMLQPNWFFNLYLRVISVPGFKD